MENLINIAFDLPRSNPQYYAAVAVITVNAATFEELQEILKDIRIDYPDAYLLNNPFE